MAFKLNFFEEVEALNRCAVIRGDTFCAFIDGPPNTVIDIGKPSVAVKTLARDYIRKTYGEKVGLRFIEYFGDADIAFSTLFDPAAWRAIKSHIKPPTVPAGTEIESRVVRLERANANLKRQLLLARCIQAMTRMKFPTIPDPDVSRVEQIEPTKAERRRGIVARLKLNDMPHEDGASSRALLRAQLIASIVGGGEPAEWSTSAMRALVWVLTGERT